MILEDEDEGKRCESCHDRDAQSLKSTKECKKCNLVFETWKWFKAQMKVNHSKEFKCKVCGSWFEEQWKLEKH